MTRIITYRKALAKVQKGFNKKDKDISDKSIDFMKILLLRTVEDKISNALPVLQIATGFYFQNPTSEKTKRMMLAQKETLVEMESFLMSLRKMKKTLNGMKVIESHMGNPDFVFSTIYLRSKAKQ